MAPWEDHADMNSETSAAAFDMSTCELQVSHWLKGFEFNLNLGMSKSEIPTLCQFQSVFFAERGNAAL